MTETNRINEIEKYLEELYTKKQDKMANFGFLILSLVLFFSLGLLNYSISGIVTLLVVLFIHELGHFIGMRAFGYKNVNIFFIPFLGAATSGIETNQSGAKKAIISLLGPLPGIVIGTILGILYFKTKQEIYIQPARFFLLINAFNLLPFTPLDGGRFIENIFFPRSLTAEVIFKIVSGLGLLAVAFLLKSFFLGIISIVFLVQVKKIYHIGKIAKTLNDEIPPEHRVADFEIQKQYIEDINDRLNEKTSVKPAPREVAIHIRNIFQRLGNLPPKKTVVLGFVVFYIFCIGLSAIIPFIFETGVAISYSERKIEYYIASDGFQKKKEVYYYKEKIIGFTEVANNYLFHGKAEKYYPDTGKIKQTGNWSDGKWDGEWIDYDNKGNVVRISTFDKGHLLLMKELTKDGWVEKKIDDIPKIYRMTYLKHANGKPEGPKVRKRS